MHTKVRNPKNASECLFDKRIEKSLRFTIESGKLICCAVPKNSIFLENNEHFRLLDAQVYKRPAHWATLPTCKFCEDEVHASVECPFELAIHALADTPEELCQALAIWDSFKK